MVGDDSVKHQSIPSNIYLTQLGDGTLSLSAADAGGLKTYNDGSLQEKAEIVPDKHYNETLRINFQQKETTWQDRVRKILLDILIVINIVLNAEYFEIK